MGYYDIDDVLADGTDFPCKFQYDIPGLGYLENNPGRPITKNTKLNLPLWLARILAIVGGDEALIDEEPVPFVELLPPEMFSTKVMNAIKTDPVALDLHSINSHFFSLAIKWITLFSEKELANVVSELLLQRAQELNHHASSLSIDVNSAGKNSANTNIATSTFLLKLEEMEKEIYKKSHESYKDTKRWMFKK
ncbi:CDN_1a_G0047380.mRNA.1.CDS.1 [Saccharomyces cerevisiae]|nr:Psf3p [Saccharomyces cerevisiae YJM1399]CAI4758976.1 BBM_1a_G0047290.mRNA.1.CDS.1 [Saccharomyces cerevisiae]CAI4767536.1 ADE_G0047160.mRNA.1.CDS.1 [Saccharomyces cerevisiae]CAI4774728.1 CDN_1a_G0047380.mRNA.1.CDS.1 [Saccharomyces cerevisiae]CAI6869959.1 ADE_G0047160.mRNA.1.CDS.1 [Saccharomyces cerevisiae]